jgi:hypothetical protein
MITQKEFNRGFMRILSTYDRLVPLPENGLNIFNREGEMFLIKWDDNRLTFYFHDKFVEDSQDIFGVQIDKQEFISLTRVFVVCHLGLPINTRVV